eukprot:64752-Chlamydomonas_euryale.AAC.13
MRKRVLAWQVRALKARHVAELAEAAADAGLPYGGLYLALARRADELDAAAAAAPGTSGSSRRVAPVTAARWRGRGGAGGFPSDGGGCGSDDGYANGGGGGGGGASVGGAGGVAARVRAACEAAGYDVSAVMRGGAPPLRPMAHERRTHRPHGPAAAAAAATRFDAIGDADGPEDGSDGGGSGGGVDASGQRRQRLFPWQPHGTPWKPLEGQEYRRQSKCSSARGGADAPGGPAPPLLLTQPLQPRGAGEALRESRRAREDAAWLRAAEERARAERGLLERPRGGRV